MVLVLMEQEFLKKLRDQTILHILNMAKHSSRLARSVRRGRKPFWMTLYEWGEYKAYVSSRKAFLHSARMVKRQFSEVL